MRSGAEINQEKKKDRMHARIMRAFRGTKRNQRQQSLPLLLLLLLVKQEPAAPADVARKRGVVGSKTGCEVQNWGAKVRDGVK